MKLVDPPLKIEQKDSELQINMADDEILLRARVQPQHKFLHKAKASCVVFARAVA